MEIVLFLVSAAISVVISPTFWGINELIRLYAGVALFFIAGVVLATEETFNRFAKAFILMLSVPVGLSFLQKMQMLPLSIGTGLKAR